MWMLLPILAISLSGIGSVHAAGVESCETMETSLKREQYTILEREEDLSQKVKSSQSGFEKAELEKLIKRHHTAIELFNLRLDDFNQQCGPYIKSKDEPAGSKPSKSTSTRSSEKTANKVSKKTSSNKISGKLTGSRNPEKEVAASAELIKTLKGYFIQAGAFKHRANAVNLQTELAKKEIANLIITRAYIYALWIGPYEESRAAQAAKESLLTDYEIEGYIIHLK